MCGSVVVGVAAALCWMIRGGGRVRACIDGINDCAVCAAASTQHCTCIMRCSASLVVVDSNQVKGNLCVRKCQQTWALQLAGPIWHLNDRMQAYASHNRTMTVHYDQHVHTHARWRLHLQMCICIGFEAFCRFAQARHGWSAQLHLHCRVALVGL